MPSENGILYLNGHASKLIYGILGSIIVIVLSWTASSLNTLQQEIAVFNVQMTHVSKKLDNDVEYLKERIRKLEREMKNKTSNAVLEERINSLEKLLEQIAKKE